MDKYELTVIVPPELSEEDRDKILTKVEELIKANKGEVASRDMWGRRELAYPIKKYKEGIYVLFTFTAPKEGIKDIDYKTKINDDIIRYLLVKADK
jgi:small subunit ribosomal protein S6